MFSVTWNLIAFRNYLEDSFLIKLFLNLLNSSLEATTYNYLKSGYKMLSSDNMEVLHFFQASCIDSNMLLQDNCNLYIVTDTEFHILKNAMGIYICHLLVTLKCLTFTLMRLTDFQVNQGDSISFTNWLSECRFVSEIYFSPFKHILA